MSNDRRRRKRTAFDSSQLSGLEDLTTASIRGASLPRGNEIAADDSQRVTEEAVAEEVVGAVVLLPIASVRRNPDQPRKRFDERELQDLADSIAEVGSVMTPVQVRRADDGQFDLIAGERRWRAAQRAGLDRIRAIIEGVDDQTAEGLALVENMGRADLNPIEEARGCAQYMDHWRTSPSSVARMVGRSRSGISHLMGLLNLPDAVQDLIAAGALSEGHGKALRRLDFDKQGAFAARCAEAGWSVRELERQIDASLEDPRSARTPLTANADRDAAFKQLSEQVAPVFGTAPVKIAPGRRGTFALSVEFKDFDTLKTTVKHLARSASRAGDDTAS